MYGSTPQSPKRSVHKSGPQSPRPSEDGHEVQMSSQELISHDQSSPPRTSTPEIKVTTSPQNTEPSSSIEHVNLERDYFEAAEEAREVKPMVQVALGMTEGDFISPEAQKLAGEILEESQLEDSVPQSMDGNIVEENHNEGTGVIPEGNLDGGEQETVQDHRQQADSDLTTDETTEHETMDAASVLVDDSSGVEVSPEEANMESKSSTIFVDMSNLTFQQEDTNT